RDRLAYPRSSTIAHRSGLGKRTVQRCLSSLEEKGLIERVRHPGRGKMQYDPDGLREAVVPYALKDPWAWRWPEKIKRKNVEDRNRAGRSFIPNS
ncbi:MAG TPA: helix-turn-helix domain-containing protein, partial [Alphaproteobacteria bacterium]|nr:helix-turn-helix domain-containing protein [Alphaproteobacteria bacterium]